jgi:predicted small lipoprotein YifL
MQTFNRFITSDRGHLLLVLALAGILLTAVSACGKKGPLYLEPEQDKSEKK